MDLDDIETIAVLGAGNMGHGIAEVAALAGYTVNLRDIKEEFVQNGYESIEWSLNKLAEKEQISQEEADAALDRVTPIVDLEEATQDVDFVIEAVPERMDIKQEVYEELEACAPDHAIFATNTSSLSITDLSEFTERPERFCGMHFFNPPVRMQLVEVISGAHTNDEVLDVTEELAEDMGKTPVRVRKDSPGFIVNRVAVPVMNEVAWMVHEDEYTIAAIDSTTKYQMGLPMGSFELADYVGIDVSYHVLDYVNDVLGQAYEPCPLLEEKVENEQLGKKTGQGFYDYENGGVDIPTDKGDDTIEAHLLAVMANEVAKLIQDDVADAPEIDHAVMLGLGYPNGPAKMADDHGIPSLVDALNDAREKYDHPRYEAADYLVELAEHDDTFHDTGDADDEDGSPSFDTLQIEVEEKVAILTLDRPHRMNTISGDLLDEFAAAIDTFEADDAVRAILLQGTGEKAFSAGADVQSMAGSADPIDAVELSRKGQHTFGKLEEVDLPVVAVIDGFCLGGGMELATCADMRIASKRSELGQPEHKLGLLPGWGGTQRLKHIVGEGRAKEIIFTADRFDAETMEEYGFLNDVTENDAIQDRGRELAKKLAAGPPLAQRYTKRAMHAGRNDTQAGLEMEASFFGHLNTTEDFWEGLAAFQEDRDPEFEGK